MKYLKSTSGDLKLLFDQQITVQYITESLRSFDDSADTLLAKNFMKKMDYDVMGIRQNGKIIGYIKQNDLDENPLAEYISYFKESDIIPYTTSLIEVFQAFSHKDRLFIESFNEVSGIVTKGDLQKHPVRMWLFGIISLVEMQMLRIIREYCPDETWKIYLTENRIKKAQDLYDDRVNTKQNIDPIECLQYSDKRMIIPKNESIFRAFKEPSKRHINNLLKETERIRNKIAHSQDYLVGDWPNIFNIIDELFEFLKKCEKINYTTSS